MSRQRRSVDASKGKAHVGVERDSGTHQGLPESNQGNQGMEEEVIELFRGGKISFHQDFWSFSWGHKKGFLEPVLVLSVLIDRGVGNGKRWNMVGRVDAAMSGRHTDQRLASINLLVQTAAGIPAILELNPRHYEPEKAKVEVSDPKGVISHLQKLFTRQAWPQMRDAIEEYGNQSPYHLDTMEKYYADRDSEDLAQKQLTIHNSNEDFRDQGLEDTETPNRTIVGSQSSGAMSMEVAQLQIGDGSSRHTSQKRKRSLNEHSRGSSVQGELTRNGTGAQDRSPAETLDRQLVQTPQSSDPEWLRRPETNQGVPEGTSGQLRRSTADDDDIQEIVRDDFRPTRVISHGQVNPVELRRRLGQRRAPPSVEPQEIAKLPSTTETFRESQESLTVDQEQEWNSQLLERCRVEKSTMLIKIEQLIPPVRERGIRVPDHQVRPITTLFLNSLKERMKRSDDSVVLPFLLWVHPDDCPNKQQFDHRMIDEYRYIVLGGNHSACAKADLHRAFPCNSSYAYAQAWVYAGLSKREARIIAIKHNVDNEFRTKMNNIDRVEFIHYRYEENGFVSNHELRLEICGELGWKANGSQDTNNYNDFWLLAMRPPPVWDYIKTIFQKWGSGEIKGQRKVVVETTKKKKPAVPVQRTISDLPLMYWRSLSGLNGREDVINSVLQRVIEGELTLKEMDQELVSKKFIIRVEEAFCSVLGMKSFTEVKDAYPEHTTPNHVQALAEVFKSGGSKVGKKRSGKPSTEVDVDSFPIAFTSFIAGAKNWRQMKLKADQASENDICSSFNVPGENAVKYLIVKGDATKLHECIIRRPYTLGIVDLPKRPTSIDNGVLVQPWGEPELSNMLSSFKLMNTGKFWRFVVFHSLQQREAVLKVLSECSGGVEECVWYMGEVKPSTDRLKLSNGFEMFTVGFHCEGSERIPSHICGEDYDYVNAVAFDIVKKKLRHSGDGLVVNPDQKPRGLLNWVVEMFSEKGDWTLDLCSGSATGLCSALASCRNCIAVEIDQRQVAAMTSRVLLLPMDVAGDVGDGLKLSQTLPPGTLSTVVHSDPIEKSIEDPVLPVPGSIDVIGGIRSPSIDGVTTLSTSFVPNGLVDAEGRTLVYGIGDEHLAGELVGNAEETTLGPSVVLGVAPNQGLPEVLGSVQGLLSGGSEPTLPK